MTYPDESVRAALATRFVPVELNTVDAPPEVKAVLADLRFTWTPLTVWMDHHGRELRRQVGYLPPATLLAEFDLAEAYGRLFHAEHAEAREGFLAAAMRHPDAASAPEALYWAGVAGLRSGHREQMVEAWHALRDRYPQSTWWERASFIDA